jgi:hypothetical protein
MPCHSVSARALLLPSVPYSPPPHPADAAKIYSKEDGLFLDEEVRGRADKLLLLMTSSHVTSRIACACHAPVHSLRETKLCGIMHGAVQCTKLAQSAPAEWLSTIHVPRCVLLKGSVISLCP